MSISSRGPMKSIAPLLVGVALAMFAVPSNSAVTIEWTFIGDSGNIKDTTGYGAVAYNYKIARNETTISQYAEFLNAVAKTDPYTLYNPNMATDARIAGITRSGTSGNYSYSVVPGTGDKPISWVSWFDAARFANWIQNGQPVGGQDHATTQEGAYTLDGMTSGVIVKRNAGAIVWIPSESEWYKAAYYDPTKDGVGGYWLQANQSDSIGSNVIGVAGAANFNHAATQPLSMMLTDVGSFGSSSQSYYGTNDQAGNVYEWNEAIIAVGGRCCRGGCFQSNESWTNSTKREAYAPYYDSVVVGFRLASVPEPRVIALALPFCYVVLARRKR